MVATAIVNPIFAARSGIIGFNSPVYMSFIKCAPDNQKIGIFSDLMLLIVSFIFLFFSNIYSHILKLKFFLYNKCMQNNLGYIVKNSLTYKIFLKFCEDASAFIETLGQMGGYFAKVIKLILRLQINVKQTVYECSRFSVDSLPITLTIVGMVSVIIAMQIAPEMAKQGGGAYIGMLVAIVMIRELAVIMSGFAIISMIGASMSAEIATMRVTDQIDAIKVLHVDPFKYLFVPKVLAGFIMMPFIVIIAATFGIICAGATSCFTAKISWLNYISSIWHGIYTKDMYVCLLKSSVFGGTIALISSSCGYDAFGGAKGVGIATTKAVVWSFVAIVIIDYIFALIFYV